MGSINKDSLLTARTMDIAQEEILSSAFSELKRGLPDRIVTSSRKLDGRVF
jgi:hypothetical protein